MKEEKEKWPQVNPDFGISIVGICTVQKHQVLAALVKLYREVLYKGL